MSNTTPQTTGSHAYPLAMDRLDRWRRAAAARPALVDGLIAATFLPLSLVARWRDHTVGVRPGDIWSVASITACWLAFAGRRTRPLAGVALAVAGVGAAAIADEPDVGLLLVAALVVYGAASRPGPVPEERSPIIATVALVAVRFVSSSFHGHRSDAASGLLVDSAVLGLALAFATASRQRIAALGELALRNELLERDRARDATMLVTEERRRIARELHDVVAHAVTIIVLQSDGAMGRAATEPELVDRSLLSIQHAGRQALDDLRRVLGVLRDPDVDDRRQPLPDLTDLTSLVTSFPDLAVTLTCSDEVAGVGPGVALAGYRIVQEALTNALRHGHAKFVTVDVRVSNGLVEVEVIDDGVGGVIANPAGHGLVGMRERVTACHGALDVGPLPHRGWRVHARLLDAPERVAP
jgi:signal transduction histidine kinase